MSAATGVQLHPPQLLAWNKLTSHIQQWFHRADFEALEVIMSAVAAHFLVEADPVWVFLIGPSGSGKTEICINAVSKCLNTYPMGDITPKTFISFYGNTHSGLLVECGASGIFLFKDFTTILSKRDDDKAEIAAQLREIYDGKWSRKTGKDGFEWEGKVTVVAACTPALERAWALRREMGDRFLTVRWPRVGSTELAKKAATQRGHEKKIRALTADYGKAFIEGAKRGSISGINGNAGERIASLAELTAIMRGTVIRDSGSRRDIIDLPQIEEAGRLNKSLQALATAHAFLWHREPCSEDFRISHRVALDSMPSARRAVLECFRNGPRKLMVTEIRKATGMPHATVVWTGDEMEALGLLTRNNPDNDSAYLEFAITDHFEQLLTAAELHTLLS